jgi:hypothetical protein
MKETNSKILSQNELENARLDIMLNVLNSVSETNEVLEFDENFGESLANSISNSVNDFVNNLSKNKITELAKNNLEKLQSKSYFPNVTEICSVPYNERLNGENLFENNVPFEIAKDITEKDKESEYYDEYFSSKDKVKFLLNIRDLSSNTGEYLSRENFSEKRYNLEKENYDKFLLTECFKDLISDSILEKFNEKENYLDKEDLENIIDDISKEKEELQENLKNQLSKEEEKEVKISKEKSFNDEEKTSEKTDDRDIEF